jgi:hypothetical protein
MSYLRTLAEPAKALMRAALAPIYGRPSNERGARLASDTALSRMYRRFAYVTELREKILVLRELEAADGRVKNLHGRVCRDMVRGGLVMQFEANAPQSLRKEWREFERRLALNRIPKLRSDARALVVEGNLPLQLVLDDRQRVAAAVRMPAETIVPMTDETGRFTDPARAYEQRDVMTGRVQARFAAWELQLARFDPMSFDDMGELGRPFLDACIDTLRKLRMTEEDLVIRRRQRAPLRLAHVLEGASDSDVDTYRQRVEGEKGEVTTDFYSSRKGSVTAIQGDANLSEIDDVVHLLDTFYAGTPTPKALFGYVDGLSRDILEDLKRDYFDEVDHLQDTHAWEYEACFRVHLLLQGIVAGPDEFRLRFSERRTETPNQVADLALKLGAIGFPPPLVWEEMGYDPQRVQKAVEEWQRQSSPYPAGGPGTSSPPVPGTAPAPPQPGGVPPMPQPARVSVTPGNARKGESATSISVPGSNGGRGRG